MTEEELYDKLEDCLCFTDNEVDSELLVTTSIENLMEFIYSHEKDIVKDFVEKVKENYSAPDKELGVNVIFLTEKELDDCIRFFFEDKV